jgi:cytidine deaminase
MPLTPAEGSIIDAANAVIDAVPRGTVERRITDHTVGSAALCSDGRIFTGINLFHFAGGPCAENVVFANAAVCKCLSAEWSILTGLFQAAGVASALSPGIGDGARLTHVVAVANDKRGVISPCGRCRQLMFDYYPDIKVIVKDGEELRTASVEELLPFAYVSSFSTKAYPHLENETK